MDNMSLKEIQSKLLLWEAAENPLAPLTADQRETILDLESMILGGPTESEVESKQLQETEDKDKSAIPPVETTYDFLDWYEHLCEDSLKANDAPYEAYYKQLEDRRNECNSLTDQISATMSDLNKLSEQYELVSNKTNALHNMSEQLLADQNKLSSIGEEIKHKLHYFTQVEHLSQRLSSTTMSVNSEAFFNILAKIDECLEYMRSNSNYKESHTYLVKYRHLQSRAISLIRSYVTHVLNHATEQVLAPRDEDQTAQETIDTAYAVYFGKFQAAAPKLRMVIKEIEDRAEHNADYATSCSLLAHACRDESALYAHFYSKTSPALE
ncbi:sec34-like family domain-containing protein [Phthorimaea operculella]|nr:sec34-like family domain-containing protein [Phthorimaea operculella]